MHRHILRPLAVAAVFLPLCALAGHPLEVEIFDRTKGRVLPVYWHEGERHVAGEPGHEYEIRIRNRSRGRVLAVTSVDGVNVISGRTASPDQSGYVLGRHERVDIDGWRKSLDDVAAFYFTRLPDSYAARTGRPENVGVIGVAVFRERVAHRQSYLTEAPIAPSAAAADEKTADAGVRREREESRLGTGHGRRLDSGARYTHFERASREPDEIIRIFYDSKRNLVARGVIPRSQHRFTHRPPEPFPGGFVPDP